MQPSGLLNPLSLYSAPISNEPARNASDHPAPGVTIYAPESHSVSASAPNARPAVVLPPNTNAGGRALPPVQSSYTISPDSTLTRKQTEVNQITIYTTEPGYRFGRLLAVMRRVEIFENLVSCKNLTFS
jgi:hypothetical protein